MKKIVLSCATCLLAVGLLAACNNDDVVEDDGEKDDGTVVEPVALEGTYYFGFEVEGELNAITGDYLYNSEGSAYTYEGAYTSTLSDAVAISAEHIDSEYYLSFVYGGSTLWITTTISSSGYTNLSYSSTKAPIYLHTSSTSEYFGTEDGLYFLCQNSTYKCLYLSDVESWMGSAPVAGLYSTSGELVLGGVGGPAYVPTEPAPVPTGDSTVKIGVADNIELKYYYLTTTTSGTGITYTDSWDDAAEFYVTSVDGGVTIGAAVDGEGWYVYYGGSSTTLATGNTTSAVWTWTIDSDGHIVDPTSQRAIGLQHGQAVMRCYAASNFADLPYGNYFYATTFATQPEETITIDVEEFEEVETPTSGSSYYFGYPVEVTNSNEETVRTLHYLFNGSLYETYDLYCSIGSEEAIEVTVTGSDDAGWTLTYELDSTSYTIYAYISTDTSGATHYNIAGVATTDLDTTLSGLTEGASSTFSWDSTNHGFTVTFGEGEDAVTCYVSTYASYKEISISVLSDDEGANYAYSHLYTLKDEGGGDEPA